MPNFAADSVLGRLRHHRQAAEDLRAAGKITGELAFVEGDGPEIEVDATVAVSD